MRKVKVLKSSDTSGMEAAVLGRMRAGLARNSNSSGASIMPATTVREYRSEICAGSKVVSAIRKA
jgi:cyanophycinase-like exopeptidase